MRKVCSGARDRIRTGHNRTERGFSLIELLVAIAVFLLVSAAAFSLFNKHLAWVSQQQNLSGLNIGMRNSLSQIQMDLTGAGQNLLGSVQRSALPPGMPSSFSIGVMIQNNTTNLGNAACAPNASWIYPTNETCFDSFTVVSVKPCNATGGTVAPTLYIDDPGNSDSINTSSVLWGNDANPGATLANDASCYNKGDELLVITFGTGNAPTCDSGAQFYYCMGVITLTKDAQAAGNKIQLQHNPTGGSADPLGVIFNQAGGNNFGKANGLNVQYSGSGYSFIIDLGQPTNEVTYAVIPNPAVANDDQLVRCSGPNCTAAGANPQVLADQVIGFKVGAALWDNASNNSTDEANYYYDASLYCNDWMAGVDCTQTPPAAYDPYDYTLIRAIRVSMVARTTPRTDLMVFPRLSNGFDGGPYMVQQGTVSVDLRNISDYN